jgi:hypothetical protein
MNVENTIIQDEKKVPCEKHNKTPNASRYPWYVYLIGGYSLTGLFSWYLITQQLWNRNRRPLAAMVFGVNAVILTVVYWLEMKADMTWWRFETVLLAFNLALRIESDFFSNARLWSSRW